MNQRRQTIQNAHKRGVAFKFHVFFSSERLASQTAAHFKFSAAERRVRRVLKTEIMCIKNGEQWKFRCRIQFIIAPHLHNRFQFEIEFAVRAHSTESSSERVTTANINYAEKCIVWRNYRRLFFAHKMIKWKIEKSARAF